ncbi:MAG: hypothetical protein KC609_15850 [Myxococcales bacterium]|nr:hypothetical protein [Myxococcales bacterium]
MTNERFLEQLSDQRAALDEAARELAQMLRRGSPERELAQRAREVLKASFDHTLTLDERLHTSASESADASASEMTGAEQNEDSLAQLHAGRELLRALDRLCCAIEPPTERELYRDGALGLIRLITPPSLPLALRATLIDGIVERYTGDSSLEKAMESLVARLQNAGYKVPERPESKVAQSFQLADDYELIWGQVRRTN